MAVQAVRRTGVILAIVGAVCGLAGPADAWYSPVNTWQQSAPPAPPGLFGATTCLIQSMDGNIFGTAFAKAVAVNGACLTLRAQVVYGASGQLGPWSATV